MAPAWIRKYARRLIPTPPPTYRKPKPSARTRLLLEQFEDRVVPVTNSWIGAAGDLLWTTPGNWSLGHIPLSTEDVDILDVGTPGVADQTIVINTGSAVANHLTMRENLIVEGFSATLTLDGDLAINSGATLTLSTGLTAGTFLAFNSTSAAANQQVTTDGNGKIILVSSYVRQNGVGHTVTFAPGVTVSATGTGQMASTNGGLGGTWVNQGTWTAAAGGVLNLVAGTLINDIGGIWEANTGTFNTGGNWDNNGTLRVASGTMNLAGASSGIGTIDYTSGAINITGTVDNVGQTMTLPGPGTYVLTGTINGGTVATTNGAILQVSPTGHLNGVTIQGNVNAPGATTGSSAGTFTNVTVAAGSVVDVGNRVVLNGITIAGTVNVTTTAGSNALAASNPVSVLNGLTFNGGTINLIGGVLKFPDQIQTIQTQAIGGSGTITYRNSGTVTPMLWVSRGAVFGSNYTPGGTLNIAAGITVQAAANNARIIIGAFNDGMNADLIPFDTFVNNAGTIRANLPGSVVTVKSRNYSPPGFPGGPDGGSVFTNTGLLEATDGTVDIDYTFWSNASGQIVMDGGTLDLRGNVSTANLGSITRTGGTVNLRGRIINTGTTFTLDSDDGTWNFVGGTIDGGHFATTGTGQLIVTASSTLLGGVILDSPIIFSNGGLSITGGLMLNNVTLTLPATSNNLSFTDNSGLAGGGTIRLTGGIISATGSDDILNIAQGITIRGRGQIGAGNSRLINQGVIEADLDGQAINVYLGRGSFGTGLNAGTLRAVNGATLGVFGISTWTNSGTIETNASTLNINTVDPIASFDYRGHSWVNTGTITAVNSTVNLGGVFTQSQLGNFVRAGGTVNLMGRVVGGLTLNDTLGTWRMVAGAVLDGGIHDVVTGSTARLQVANGGATPLITFRNHVTLRSPLDFAFVNGGKVLVDGTLTLDDITQDIGNTTGISGFLNFANTGLIDGTGTIHLNDGTIGQETSGSILTIGPNILIEARAGTIGWGPARLFNQGTIRSTIANLSVNVFLGQIIPSGPNLGQSTGAFGGNSGTIEAINGSVLGIHGGSGWTNTGTIRSIGSVLSIQNFITNAVNGTGYHQFSWTNAGTISVTNSTFFLGGVLTQSALGSATPQPGQGTLQLSNSPPRLIGTIVGGLTLDDSTGSWWLSNGGTLNGGTFAIAPGSTSKLFATATSSAPSFLTNGVTLNSPIEFVSVSGAQVNVTGGLTLNTTMTLNNAAGTTPGVLSFTGGGAQTLRTTSAGTIVIRSGNINGSSTPLTVGPGITLLGGGGNSSSSITGFGGLVNQGTIISDVANQEVQVNLGNGGRNDGMIQGVNGGRLRITANATNGAWTNIGTIAITNGSIDLGFSASESWTNLGTIIANNSTVNLKGMLTQTRIGTLNRSGGTITLAAQSTLTGDLTLDESTGSWIMNGASIINGRIRTLGPTALQITSGVNRFFSCIVDGQIDMTTFNGANLELNGGLTLNTTLQVGNSSGSTYGLLFTRDTQTISGTGTILFGGSIANTFGGNGASPTVTIDSGITLRGKFVKFNNNMAALINKGTISSDGFGSFDVFPPIFTNLGTVRVGPSSELVLHPGTLTNLVNTTIINNIRTGTLSGGNWVVGPSGLLRIWFSGTQGVQFDRLNANVTLDGLNSRILGGQAGSAFANIDGLGAFSSILGDGRLALMNGRSLTPTGNFTTAGVLEIGNGSGFSPLGGVYIQTGGSTQVLENAVLFAGSPAGKSVQNLGGTLSGNGTINASVINSGTVAPGTSPGFLDITGDYTQTASGILNVEIAGRDPNIPQYDRLRVTGTATLDGTLLVTLLDGFEPAPGDEFRAISAGSRVGQFANQQFPTPGGTLRRLVGVYDSTGLILQTQQLPPVDFGFVTTQSGTAGSSPVPDKVATDATGNAYVIGRLFGTTDFDAEGPATGVTPDASLAGYVAKYGPGGNLIWFRILDAGLGGSAEAGGVAIDPISGDILVTGWYGGALTIADGGTVTLPSAGAAGETEAFIVRLTTTGQVVWARATDGSPAARGNDVAVGTSGIVYVVGSFTGSADFNPDAGTAILSANGIDAFVWALSASGAFVAADQLSGNSSQTALSVAVRSSAGADTVWITGATRDATSGLAILAPAAAGSEDIFVLKLTRSGGGFVSDPAVSAVYGSDGRDVGTAIAVAGDGSAVIAGSFELGVDFDKSAVKAFTLVSGGDSDAFVLKLGSDGGFHWARGFGGYRADAPHDLALNGIGDVYLAGTFSDFVDFNPLDGSYVLSTENDRAFLAKITADGDFGWATDLTAPAGWASHAFGIASGPGARVVAVGQAGGPTGSPDFDPSEGVNSPIPAGQTRGFVWALDQKAAPVAEIVGLPEVIVNEGSTLALASSIFDLDSAYFTYSWSATRNGLVVATGTGPVFTANLAEQGNYEITLVVFDESGNRTTRTATVSVNNAPPVLNATAYGSISTFASSAGVGDNVPSAIASGGGLVLLGVSRRDAGAPDAGAVDVYTTSGDFVRTLSAPVAVAGAQFGAAIAVVGNLAIIGAPGAGAGTAYVYDLSTGALVRTFTGPAAQGGDRFGAAVAALGNLVAIGSPGRSEGGAAGAGAAYLYDPSSGELLQTYQNPTPQANDAFGTALVAAGGNLLIGAPGDDSAGVNAGAAYLLDPGLARVLRTVANPNPSFPGSNFGSVLAASGLRAAIGAPLDDSAGTDAGGVYFFDLDPTSSTFGSLLGTVRSPNPSPNLGRFGSSLAFAGNRLLVGADGDGTTLANSGSAFLINAEFGTPAFGTSLRTFKDSTPVANDRFGAIVAFVGDDVLIGAPQDDAAASDAGRVYRFNASSFLNAAANVPENGMVSVSGSFFDSGSTDAHTVLIDWADGSVSRLLLAPGVSSFSAVHQYLDDGPSPGNGTASDNYGIRVRILDNAPNILVADFVAGGADIIYRFDGATGSSLGTFAAANASGVAGAGDISGVTVGPDGLVYVAYQGGGNPIVRFDPITGLNLGVFIANGPTTSVAGTNNLAFGPGGSLVAFDSVAGYFRRFDGQTGAPIAAPPGSGSSYNDPNPTGAPYSPQGWAFGPDGNLYVGTSGASAADPSSIVRFNGATGAFLGNFTTSATLPTVHPSDLQFFADGSLNVLVDGPTAGTRTLLQLDGQTGEVVREFEVAGSPSGNDSFLSSPGGSVLIQDYTGRVERFDHVTGEGLATVLAPPDGGLSSSGIMVNLNPQDSTTSTVTVTNVPPTVAVRAEPNPNPGQYSLSATVSDVGTLDGITYSWTIAGGTALGPTNGSTFSFSVGSSSVTVTLVVNDDDLGTVTYRTQIIVGTATGELITINNGQARVGSAPVIPIPTSGNIPNKVIVFGLGGNDTIDAGPVTNFSVELIGGFGSDTLVGGAQGDLLLGKNPGDYALADPYSGDTGADSLTGGLGNDTLDGGLGDDTVAGGGGNDHYLQVPGSADLLTEAGGSGIDTIDYSLAFSGVSFTLGMTGPQLVDSAGGHTVEIQGTFENLFGSVYSDVLSGNSLDNLIGGGGGNDLIYGDGRDLGFGGALLDTLAAITGDGNDTLAGGAGIDTVIGGAGNDVIFGGDLLATLSGGTAPTPTPDTGSNSLVGGTGNDTVIGGSGNDVIFGGDLLNSISSTWLPDNDSIVGGVGNDTIIGGAGNDVIFGGDLLSSLAGASGPSANDNNTIVGGQGSDTVVGGAGNDVIFGGDLLVSLPGAPSSAPLPDTSPNSLVGGAGNDTLIGGAGNDVIFGGDLLATIEGGSAPGADDNNTIIGGQGSDTVVGGAGNDVIFGGDLLVTISRAVSPAPSGPDTNPNSLIGGSGNDTIIGGAGNDVIFGGDLLSSLAGAGGASGNDDNTIVGGQGSDTVVGGVGNDVIFGGDLLVSLEGSIAPPAPPAPDNNPNSLIGGAGNDTIIGGSGNDVIFGGDLLATISTDSSFPTLSRPDDDSLAGGGGNDTVVGGSGNDVIFGGDLLVSLAGFTGPTPVPAIDGSTDSLVGGTGNDTVIGGTGNDVIFGGEGDDVLTGGAGNDVFEGGSGLDAIAEAADVDFVLTTTQLFIGGSGERFYDIERAILSGGAGNDRLDASAFKGPVTLTGAAGNDTLLGGAGDDQLIGGDGNDSLVGFSGADTLDPGRGADYADGGAGNDTYVLQLDGQQTLIDLGGIDSIDLSAAAFGVDADLNAGTIKFAGLSTILASMGGSFENLRGSAYGDVIVGNAERNILEGGGGIDDLDGGNGADIVQGSRTQVVYLDFDSGTGKGEHLYTIEERNRIQDRLEKTFAAPLSISFTQTAPAIGRFSTITFNAGEAEVLVAGLADELDWRNVNAAARAQINVNGFLGRVGQPAATSDNYVALTVTVSAHEMGHLLGLRHTDSFGPIGSGIYSGLTSRVTSEILTPTVSAAQGSPGSSLFVLKNAPVLLEPVTQFGNALPNTFTPANGTIFAGATAVATFTVVPDSSSGSTIGIVQITPIGTPVSAVVGGFLDANTGGLVLHWSVVPETSSIRVTYQFDPFRPTYRGPDDAVETALHIMASPASVGTTLRHALGDTHFGERELLKLAFNDAGSTQIETALPVIAAPVGTGAATARDLGTLPGLSVPNSGNDQNGYAQVRSTNVVGTITLAGGASENDVYSFQGRAGEYLTAEILSDSLRHRFATTIDSILRIYGPSGQLLRFYGQDAINDDGLDSLDSVIQDVLLTEDGTYFVVVDTFASGAIPDMDTGSYELFLYTYRPAQSGSTRLGGEGDELTGGGGSDVLIGSAGDDAFDGDALEDTFVGFNSGRDRVGPKNSAPEVVVEQTREVAEDGSLTFIAGTDADGDRVTATITQQPCHGSVSFDEQTGLLTYIPSANFNGADSFRYTLSDDLATSPEAIVSITVTSVNDAPVADPLSAITDEDVSVSRTLSGSDLDGDPLRFALAGTPVGGSVTIDGLTGGFTFTPAANFNGLASFSFTVSDGGLTSAEAQVIISVTPVNDAPVANALSITTDEDVAVGGTLIATDIDGDALTFALAGTAVGGTVTSFDSATGVFIFTPAANFNGEAGFAFTATDGTLTSPPAQITINVTAVNDPPTATVFLNAAQPRTNDVLTAIVTTSDVEEDAVILTYEWRVNGELKRTVTTTALTDSFDLSQNENGNKGDMVTVTVTPNDGTANGASVSASAVIVNSAPVAASHSFSTTSNAALVVGAPGLLVGAVDSDGDSLNVVSFTPPASGTLSVAADGSFIYTPAAAFDGTVSFEYSISDGEITTTGTATIHVVAVNAVVLNAGDLFVYGTMGVDAISLIQSAEGILVTLNGTNYGPYLVTGTIRAYGRDGNDSILLDPTVLTPANLYGESGNDTLLGGSAADRLEGNDGADLLMAGSGNDTLYGGLGNDTLVSGTDDDSLYGEDGDDSLVATSGNDLLSGGSGSDSLTGGSGDDVLHGGEGNDSLNGGAGNDILFAGSGDDSLAGSAGDDYLDAGEGNDWISGGAGADILVGGEGNDFMLGGSDRDLVIGGRGADTLVGNAADDILIAGYSIYDANAFALRQILGIWTSGLTYAERTAALQSSSFAFRLVSGQTLFDDDDVDYLTGSAGADWFFANVDGTGARDVITDLGNNEDYSGSDPEAPA